MAPTGTGIAFRYGAGGKGTGIGKDGHRLLRQPRGIHVDRDGSLYVADFTNFCVFRFAESDNRGHVVAGEDGKQLLDVDYLKDIDRPLATPEGEGFLLKNPIDVVTTPDGLLILDCAAARVQAFEPSPSGQTSAGRVLVPYPMAPSAKSVAAPEALKHPRSFLCHEASIVVCDTWSHRVLRFKASSTSAPDVLAGTPNSCGSEAAQLNFPSCIAFCADGSLLVSDTNNHRIQRFRPGERQGETLAGSAECKAGSSLTELNMPTGLVVETDGSFLVADRANARVLRFHEGGGAGEMLAGPDVLERPWGLALGPDGSIYVSDERRAVVLKITSGKKAAKSAAPPQSSGYPPQAKQAKQAGGYPPVAPANLDTRQRASLQMGYWYGSGLKGLLCLPFYHVSACPRAVNLPQELLSTYSAEGFQKKVHGDAKAVMFEFQPFLKRLKKTAFLVPTLALRAWLVGNCRASHVGRSGTHARLAFVLGATYLALDGLGFVGAGLTGRDSRSTQMRGYRLDKMLEASDGDRSLQTSEGYWVGEKGFEKSQWAQGYRYRMRASPEEFKKGIDCPAPLQIGPFKWKIGEMLGGTGNNDKLRQLKKEIAQAGLDDPKKIAENEYWLKRYGHKRWFPKYVDQSGAKGQTGLFRGLAAWSGYDPLNEERGKTWIEADYGKPLMQDKKGIQLPGLLTKEQMQKELDSGKLPKPGA
ncbi:trim71 [Symbiodinium pilosum]|uniref:Trim71 protein n=1 Tax=Symbiodinium pilosum TaxID=2952 RepID=A0A812JZ78_SYMPI|nr:trim71 [Symbiodinium pilosum]